MSQNAKQILIVEDEDTIRSSLRKLLERYDYAVSEAVSKIPLAPEAMQVSMACT